MSVPCACQRDFRGVYVLHRTCYLLCFGETFKKHVSKHRSMSCTSRCQKKSDCVVRLRREMLQIFAHPRAMRKRQGPGRHEARIYCERFWKARWLLDRARSRNNGKLTRSWQTWGAYTQQQTWKHAVYWKHHVSIAFTTPKLFALFSILWKVIWAYFFMIMFPLFRWAGKIMFFVIFVTAKLFALFVLSRNILLPSSFSSAKDVLAGMKRECTTADLGRLL